VINAPYEPGSVMKALTLATGIDRGVIEPSSTYNNTDYVQEEGWPKPITNATKGQTGIISMQHAFNYSLNTGMVTVAQRLGGGNRVDGSARNVMYEYFH